MYWPKLEGFINGAVGHSHEELHLPTIKQTAEDGDVILLSVESEGKVYAAMTIEKITFSTGKRIMHIMTVGGENMSEWLSDAIGVLDKIAKDHNCSEIYGIGRAGWVKTLSSHGYEVLHTTLRKTVGN